MKNFYNLNKENIFLSCFACGIKRKIVVRLGRKLYYVDFDKNSDSTFVNFYTKNKNSEKYGNMFGFVFVKNDVILDRTFFEEFEQISTAQRIVRKYNRILK